MIESPDAVGGSGLEPDDGLVREKGMFVAASLEDRPAGAPPSAPDRPPPRARATGPTDPPVGPEPSAAVRPVPTGSFDDFYRANRAAIVRALALSLGELDVATEATDEAFARAYERWAHVSLLDSPPAWVYRVASNWALSVFRRRRLGLHRLYSPDVADAPAVADPAIHAALAELDIKHRGVVVCRHLLGWSVADTAAALGVHEGTVKSRLHRATAVLRTRLRDLDPSAPSTAIPSVPSAQEDQP